MLKNDLGDRVILLKVLLKEYDFKIYDMSKNNEFRKGDIGIFIQNVFENQLEDNKKNLFKLYLNFMILLLCYYFTFFY